mmetsp:Transcript_64427/g.119828  ORF Transcript_64427/g.119828 Transcript_64427/m.119828 type:complete len:458 (-) Transcript_64427:40-1413(-)
MVAKHIAACYGKRIVLLFAGLAQSACAVGVGTVHHHDGSVVSDALEVQWTGATSSYDSRRKAQVAPGVLLRSEDATKAGRVSVAVESGGENEGLASSTSPMPLSTTVTNFAPCEANRESHCRQLTHCAWVQRPYMEGCVRDCQSFTEQAKCTAYQECRWATGARTGCTDAEPICGTHATQQLCQAQSSGTTHEELICTWSAWRGCILKSHLECADLDEQDCQPGLQDCTWSVQKACIRMLHAQCGDYNKSACLFFESGKRGCWWQDEDNLCYKRGEARRKPVPPDRSYEQLASICANPRPMHLDSNKRYVTTRGGCQKLCDEQQEQGCVGFDVISDQVCYLRANCEGPSGYCGGTHCGYRVKQPPVINPAEASGGTGGTGGSRAGDSGGGITFTPGETPGGTPQGDIGAAVLGVPSSTTKFAMVTTLPPTVRRRRYWPAPNTPAISQDGQVVWLSDP